MTGPRYRRISTRAVEAMSCSTETVFWDRDLPGFGVRVDPSGSKVYVARADGPDGPETVALGRHETLSADRARRRAAQFVSRIRAGRGAAPADLPEKSAEPTLAEIAGRYLREHAAVRCKPSTAAQYRSTIEKHILPALGDLPASSVEPTHVADLQYALGHLPAAANLAVSILARLIDHAVDRGAIPDRGNPCRFARKNRTRRRERFLTDAEFRRLGRALASLESEGALSAHAAAAIRLLILTGCRRNEILTLRWDDVHPEAMELRLRDAKTGPRTVPLSPAAARVLADLPRVPDNPWVVPGGKPGAHLSGIFSQWCRVRARARLKDVRIHDLRHSFASRALALGESLPMIARLLGHARIQTTARYAHLARDAVREAASRVAADIGEDILPRRRPGPDPLPPKHGVDAAELADLKASAARIAARIGEDVLPMHAFGAGPQNHEIR